ncbi:very-long-chain (3R)-3-hydroxyacyl-CoA dehydratase 4 isoform X3 [Pangasianodon hypophthalmus]|uniref:very-long-chain (3R)-3-hydroxyacyl-CoA dehydratase 4 isoform X3 n=1 Tax=Pangasianodon hypophthalmus TaxID=310915 RepID=UPI00147A6D06|nr:very-long-chain (3R)-3-hydroxyacyl-CoA dehydratase 4 isoform X3 [Pangasianodon hypophthalmus]
MNKKSNKQQKSEREAAQEMRCSIGFGYLFSYYLLQFCGHTWIFSNMTARFLSFGLDALAGTFYFVGVMMSMCQLLSVLELFHIADGIEESQLLPRLVQVIERNFLLFLIISQEEFQSKTVVCVLFYLWNILHLIRNQYFTGVAILRVTRHIFCPAENTCLYLCTFPIPANGLPPSVGSRFWLYSTNLTQRKESVS